MFIPDPQVFFFILDPGSRGPESTGTRIPIRIRNTALHTKIFLLGGVPYQDVHIDAK
jgi:hypothetical protein